MKCGFGSSSLLDFSSFVPLKICLLKSLHNLKKAQKERPPEMMLYYT